MAQSRSTPPVPLYVAFGATCCCEQKSGFSLEMATVKVDRPTKRVTITTKPGKTLSNAKIKEIVTYSGYLRGNRLGNIRC